MSISSLFLFLIIDLETLTTLIPESIPGQTQRCLIAICLSQQVPGNAWQVWQATKSVAGAFRCPRCCGCHTFVAATLSATLLPHFSRECSFFAVPSLSLSAQRDPLLFTIYILDLETLTTLIMRSIPSQTRRYLIAIRLSQQVPGRPWQVWHATKRVASVACHKKCGRRVSRPPLLWHATLSVWHDHTSATLFERVLFLGGSLSVALCTEGPFSFCYIHFRP